MELDAVQEWIDSLYKEITARKELAEYYSCLLSDIKDPWPLSQAPVVIQDSYRKQMQQDKIDEEQQVKLSEFDKELKTVENILQKARLLRQAEPKKKISRNKNSDSKARENAENEIAKNMNSNNQRTDIQLKCAQNRSGKGYPRKPSTEKQILSKPKSAMTRKDPSRNSSKSKFQGPAKTKTGTASQSVRFAAQNMKTTSVSKVRNSPTQSSASSPAPTSEESLSSIPKQCSERGDCSNPPVVDTAKVKVQFNELKSSVSLPPKMKKLFSTHVKLKEQVKDVWRDSKCPEETNFFLNLCKKSFIHNAKPLQTLESLNEEMHQCLNICTNAINALKLSSSASPTRGQRSSTYSTCLASEILNLVEEILGNLHGKYKHVSQVQALDYNTGLCQCGPDDDDWFLSYSDFREVGRVPDVNPFPVERLTYETPKYVQNLVAERMRHKFLIIEHELVNRILESFSCLLDRLMKSEGGEVPSREFVHALQNAYGVLVQNEILLPAWVMTE